MFETFLLVWLWYNVSVVWPGDFLAYLSSVMVTEGSKWHSALEQKMWIPTGELLGLHGSCGRHMENLLMCCWVTGICKLFAGSSDCFSLQTQALHRENKPSNISVNHLSLQHRRGISSSCDSTFTDIDRIVTDSGITPIVGKLRPVSDVCQTICVLGWTNEGFNCTSSKKGQTWVLGSPHPAVCLLGSHRQSSPLQTICVFSSLQTNEQEEANYCWRPWSAFSPPCLPQTEEGSDSKLRALLDVKQGQAACALWTTAALYNMLHLWCCLRPISKMAPASEEIPSQRGVVPPPCCTLSSPVSGPERLQSPPQTGGVPWCETEIETDLHWYKM